MNDKKQRLVDTALALFYDQGINSVGINEVLKVSGIAKKTLYHHFSSKEALIIATLEARDGIFLQWLDTKLQHAPTDTELVSRLFDALTAWFKDEVPELSPFRGCFFINTSAECRDNNSDISRYCAAHKTKVRELIQQHLQTDSQPLLDIICLLKEGAIVSAYVNQDVEAAEKCIPWVLKHIDAPK